MALANYSDLTAALTAYLNRSDLVATYDTFIALFEARANRSLRVPQMEASATETVSSGSSTALPSDFLSAREIYSDATVPLKSMAAQDMRETYLNFASGTPLAYAVVGETLAFAPTVGSATTLTINYYQKIPTLSSTAPTNWLMTDYPDAYLYGALAAAYDFLRDEAQASAMLAASDRIFGEIKADAVKRRLPAGPLVMRSNVFNG